jgi:filamentous hemagglutinin
MLTEENKDDFIPMKESEYYNSASQEDRDALDALGNLYVSKAPVVIDANNATYQNGTNGMMNNEIQALRNMITQTHVEGDTNINGTLNYNPTHGFLGDLIESGVDKNGGTTGIARQTGEFMYDVTHARGTSGANFANHSQGNALVYAGVDYINNTSGFDEAEYFIDSTKIRDKQYEGLPSVVGFGSPMSYDTMNKLFVETGFEFTGNFTNENDYVGEGIGANTGHNGSATILKKLNLYNAALLFDVLPIPSPHGRYNCDPSKGQICGDRP